MTPIGVSGAAPGRRSRCGAAAIAAAAACLAVVGSRPCFAADYAPAWSAVCGMGTTIAEGCAAVRARAVVDAARYPWSAIGRVNVASISSRAHCTGVLIHLRLILTAAHCLFDGRRKQWVRAPRIHFAAGLQRGEHLGHSTAVRYVVYAAHDVTSRAYRHRPHDDWALVELRDPVGARAGYLGWSMLDPARLKAALRTGARVALAGYPAVRPHVLSADMACGGLGFRDAGALVVLGCAVMKGDSGAPLLLLKDGGARVVAVLSGAVAGRRGLRSVSVSIASFHDAILEFRGVGPSATDAAGRMGAPGSKPVGR